MNLSITRTSTRPVALAAGILFAGLLTVQSASGGTVSGEINARIVIGSGCQINGLPDPLVSPPSFGTLDFGDWITLENPGSPNIDAATSDSAGGGITIECNDSVSYNIVVDGGLHANSGVRRMLNGSTAGEYVQYGIFTDATRATPWAIDVAQGFSVNGTSGASVTTVHHFYGRVPPQNQATSGTYTDTVQVAISW